MKHVKFILGLAGVSFIAALLMIHLSPKQEVDPSDTVCKAQGFGETKHTIVITKQKRIEILCK